MRAQLEAQYGNADAAPWDDAGSPEAAQAIIAALCAHAQQQGLLHCRPCSCCALHANLAHYGSWDYPYPEQSGSFPNHSNGFFLRVLYN